MTVNAFALYLPDFARRTSDRPPPAIEMEALEPATPPEDPGRPVAEALEQGRREGLATARAEFERIRATDLVRYDERLLDERRRWTEEESDRLARQLAAALQEIEAGLVSSIARILVPFAAESIRRAALDELTETLAALLAGDGCRLTVGGPADLIEALRTRLGPRAQSIEFHPADALDIRASTGETVVETQIGAWLGRLSAAIE